jgi:N6-L-threonylcarbamoyladenine synthase
MIPELSHVCGGRAVEILASRGDCRAFQFTAPLCKYRDCNFSYAGIKNTAQRYVIKQEKTFGKFDVNYYVGYYLPFVHYIL